MAISLVLIIVLMVYEPIVSGDEAQQLALSAASSAFSQNLYQKVAINKTNVVYSPFSIHSAISMTYLGARGRTAVEMSQTLGLNGISTPHQTYRHLIDLVKWNAQRFVKLHTYNAIYVNPNESILSSYITDVSDYYVGTAANLELQDPEKAINNMVANRTNNVITNMLKPGTLDSSTVLVLVNVLFFNGTWAHPFNADFTHQEDFHQLGGAVIKVDMMLDSQGEKRIKRDDSNDLDVVALPFVGRRFSLYFVVPRQLDGILALESLMVSNQNVQQLFEGLELEHFSLSIPKFKIETSLELEDVLPSMGMQTAFTASADFSGINGSGGIYIDKVIHKAVIDVQESGTVAAAATVIDMSKGFFLASGAPVVADRPFAFFLRDDLDQQILFQGKFSG